MNAYRYDTYCGIYCGACEVMNAKTDEERARVIRMFEGALPGWHAAPDQVHCSGCKTENAFVNCRTCPIKSCARGKGVEFCFECSEFPCQIYSQLEMASDQIPVLKHIKASIKNQKEIKVNGVAKWLAAQEDKWKCPNCGTRFAWYTEECIGCKHNLKVIKDYETTGD